MVGLEGQRRGAREGSGGEVWSIWGSFFFFITVLCFRDGLY